MSSQSRTRSFEVKVRVFLMVFVLLAYLPFTSGCDDDLKTASMIADPGSTLLTGAAAEAVAGNQNFGGGNLEPGSVQFGTVVDPNTLKYGVAANGQKYAIGTAANGATVKFDVNPGGQLVPVAHSGGNEEATREYGIGQTAGTDPASMSFTEAELNAIGAEAEAKAEANANNMGFTQTEVDAIGAEANAQAQSSALGQAQAETAHAIAGSYQGLTSQEQEAVSALGGPSAGTGTGSTGGTVGT